MSIPIAVFEESIRGFLAPIASLLESDTVTEIMINGHAEIYAEERGQLRLTGLEFDSDEQLMSALRNLAQYAGRELGRGCPILEARLPDGSRVEAIVPPAAVARPIVSIRRFSKAQMTIDALVGNGSLSRPASELLELFVLTKQNIIIAGEAGSGKTSLLAALSAFALPSDRIVVVEDSAELQLPLPHVVRFESQSGAGVGANHVSVCTLLRATLRLRPDRIIVGEIRGPEALDLIQAMMSGHRGCLSTVHATHPVVALKRLENLSLMNELKVPSRFLRDQIANSVDVVVQTSRIGGFRCVTHITEVIGYDGDTGYDLIDLFVRDFSPSGPQRVEESRLIPTGHVPRCEVEIQRAGLKMPASFRSARANA